MKFPTYEEMAKDVAEKALDEILYDGKSIREWMQIIVSEDAISRQAVQTELKNCEVVDVRDEDDDLVGYYNADTVDSIVRNLPPVKPAEKVGQCKQCKWWKDSDGAYRRGMRAESKCPMNTQKVYEGDGYCYLYEPKMQEVEE